MHCQIDYSTETIKPFTGFNRKQNDILIVSPESLVHYAELICTDEKCRYPHLALRLMIHIIAGIDNNNKLSVSARQISRKFGVHYDTVTKCLKYLRSINVLREER